LSRCDDPLRAVCTRIRRIELSPLLTAPLQSPVEHNDVTPSFRKDVVTATRAVHTDTFVVPLCRRHKSLVSISQRNRTSSDQQVHAEEMRLRPYVPRMSRTCSPTPTSPPGHERIWTWSVSPSLCARLSSTGSSCLCDWPLEDLSLPNMVESPLPRSPFASSASQPGASRAIAPSSCCRASWYRARLEDRRLRDPASPGNPGTAHICGKSQEQRRLLISQLQNA